MENGDADSATDAEKAKKRCVSDVGIEPTTFCV